MARLVKEGDFVGPGERLTAEHLEGQLPSSWVVIANKTIVDPAGATRELDFIVLGDHTLFVIDEKHYHGTIRGDDKGWVLSGGASERSPISKIEMNARRLRGMLEDGNPHLRDALRNRPWVFGRVLLSAPDVACAVSDPRVATQVLRLESSVDELVLVDREQPDKASVQPFRQQVLDQLTRLKGERPHQ